MGVSVRPAPWWLTWVFVAGLGTVFLGERVLADAGLARAAASLGGAALALGVTAWRFLSWRRAAGPSRGVERLLLLAYGGCVLALVGFFLSSEDGMRWMGIAFDDPNTEGRYQTILQVLSALLAAAGILPAVIGQGALAAHRHAGPDAASVETLRVREAAAGGLTVALAGGFLLLAGYIAAERDVSLDVSYFKTARPGTASVEIVRSFDEPLRILLFFPDVNEVKDEVLSYARALAAETGRVEIVTYDRLVSPEIAREHRVTTDGTVVLVKGERVERISLSPDLVSARAQLRRLDEVFQEQLLRLAREVRVAYLTVGHGEMNDPTADTVGSDPPRSVQAVEELLRILNYRVEGLGIGQGLGTAVPGDAGMVLVLGPQRPFLTEELESLARYLEEGGSVLLALDPETAFALGPLEGRLGVRFVGEALADDQQHLRRRGNLSDRRLIVTNRFTAHEAVTTLSRSGIGAGILLVGAGYLEPVETASVEPRFVVRSLPSTFADVNGNFVLDEGREVRQSYNLVAAVELPADSAGETPGGRALVYADAGMLTDAVLASVGLNLALLADGLRWLGGEGAFAGEIESEEDVAIVHTRAEDVAWFYTTIAGAPLVVLGVGLAAVLRRRRRRDR